MKTSYLLDKEDLVNLVANHMRFMADKGREMISKGEDIRTVPRDILDKWHIEFVEREIANNESTSL